MIIKIDFTPIISILLLSEITQFMPLRNIDMDIYPILEEIAAWLV